MQNPRCNQRRFCSSLKTKICLHADNIHIGIKISFNVMTSERVGIVDTCFIDLNVAVGKINIDRKLTRQ